MYVKCWMSAVWISIPARDVLPVDTRDLVYKKMMWSRSEQAPCIRYAVDFVTDKKKSDGDADSDGDDAASGGEQMTISDEAEKKAQEQATQEQAMQTARMQAQQQTLANQSGHRQRVSMKAMLEDKKEVVRKSEEQKRSAISQEHDETQRKKRQTSL